DESERIVFQSRQSKLLSTPIDLGCELRFLSQRQSAAQYESADAPVLHRSRRTGNRIRRLSRAGGKACGSGGIALDTCLVAVEVRERHADRAARKIDLRAIDDELRSLSRTTRARAY